MGCCESTEKDNLDGEEGMNDPNRPPFQFQCLAEHGGGVNCMSMSEDGSVIATGSEDGTVRVFNSNALPCECISVMEGHEDYVSCVAVDENYIVTGSKDCSIRKWDMGTGDCVLVFEGHTSLINRVICTGDLLFSSSYDRTARCWDWNSGDLLFTMTGHSRGVYSLIYIPADLDSSEFLCLDTPHLLITGSADCDARLWDVERSHCLRTFTGHESAVTCLTTDLNGSILFTGSTDKTIRSYRTLSGENLQVFKGHQSGIITLCYSNKMLYTGSSDHTVRAWVIDTGACVRMYKGHRHTVNTVRVYNGLMITTCGDGIARVYCAKTAKLIRKFEGHSLAVNCAKLIGNRLYTCSHDGTLRVWDVRGCREQLAVGVDPDAKKKEKEKNNDKTEEIPELETTRQSTAELVATQRDEDPYEEMVDDPASTEEVEEWQS